MTANEIRSSFLRFFEEHGHTIVPSAPVIPYDDPTLLFTNAGMNQFKDVFLETGRRSYVRAVNSQKCIRVSGKHNDLEEVGRDTYHHTFFEMLGNWSFGDYYKKEAIEWAWILLTDVWGIEKKRLYATVFETDDEAEGLWKRVTDINRTHVLRFGKKDNFWEMGETGPCGPCSEIHVDLTPDLSGGRLVNAGDPRVMEIWNLVFIQYNRDGEGQLTPLPAKHVDTGMGFERICAVLQGKKSNYDTDVFMPIIGRVSDIVGVPYRGSLDDPADIAMRVIADHVRMLVFSIADGATPTNEGRGYVMRRILRRAARFGRNLGMRQPFIYRVVESVVRSMGEQYPGIGNAQPHIERVVRGEEEGFNVTLDRGLEIFESVVQRIGHSKTFPGDDAFTLYDTFGFPLDLTEMMAKERGLTVDSAQFVALMEEQRERARSAKSGEEGVPRESFRTSKSTTFVGYERDEIEGEVIECGHNGEGGGRHVNYLVFDLSPFYTESGGQVSDRGIIDILNLNRPLQVTKVYKTQGGAIVHIISRLDDLEIGMKAKIAIDRAFRRNVERNHTATHLVHEALRRVLGTHLHQQGSLVAPDRLRFDFNHFEKISPDQIRAIEDIVNEKIAAAIGVYALNDPTDWITIDEARRRYPNVKMFFGDKYGERVRIVEIDPAFSVELCGGTHVRNTREIGPFKIISEASVASGVRRIEAVTGEGLMRHVEGQLKRIGELDERITAMHREQESLENELERFGQNRPIRRPSLHAVVLPDGPLTGEIIARIDKEIAGRENAIAQAAKSANDLRKEITAARVNDAVAGIDALLAKGMTVEGFIVVAARIDAGDMEEIKRLGDALREKLKSGVGVLGAVIDGKVALVCVVTDDLIREKKLQAGTIVGELAKRVGGGGGGRPHLATAGGKDSGKLDEALAETAAIVRLMAAS